MRKKKSVDTDVSLTIFWQQNIDFEAHQDKFLEHLSGKGFIVKPQAEYESALNEARGEVGKAVGQAYTTVDQATLEATGIPKKAGEKTTDYVNRAYAEAGKKEPSQPSKPSDIEKARIEALEKELNTMKQEREAERQEATTLKINTAIREGLTGAKLALPEDATLKLFRADWTGKIEDGKTYFVDAAGKPAIKADGTPKTSLEIIQENYPFALQKDTVPPVGTGVNPANTQKADGYLGKNVNEISEALAKEGLVMGSPQWKEKYDKATALIKK